MPEKETNYQSKFRECDDKFNTIFELTSAPSKIINSDLTILRANKALTELLGYSEKEITGTKILDYACPEYKEHWHGLQDALWSRKLPFFKLDACLFRKDKSIAWVNVTTILFNDSGETFGFTIFEDITAKKAFEESEKNLKAALEKSYRTQEELRRSERHLSRILETMAEGVGIIDVLGKMTYANPMAQKILGLNESEIKERTYDDPRWQNLRIDGTLLPPEEHPMAIMMARGEPIIDYEIGVQPPGGETKYVSINAAPIHDDNGTLVGGIGTFMDVTERRKMVEKKDEFISIASHELRTPITALKASLQLMNKNMEGAASTKQSILLQQATKSLNKVGTLVGDLLNASRFNEGQLHLNKRRFKISELIGDCCDHIRIDGVYNIVTEGDVNLEVFADADRVDQVILNFINNAIKYAPESREIKVLIEQIGTYARISVIDKGKGIPEEKQPHLFKRYFRVDSGGFQYSGLGLGLYISAEIVKKHGGEVGVNSNANGSQFWFTLPING